jgi:hypothetical protein
MMARRDEQLGKREMVCTRCGARMMPRRSSHCSAVITVLLLLLWIIPGLLYIGYCMAKSQQICSVCGSSEIVPVNSPVAQRIISERDSG